MADIHGSPANAAQNPQAANSGPAPVPYHGVMPAEPPGYGVTLDLADAAAEVMNGIPSMPGVSEQSWAHDIAAGTADAPYYAGSTSAIYSPVNSDADEQDDVSGTVAGAVAAATARWQLAQKDTYQQGSVLGDLVALPPNPLDPGVGVLGTTDPSGAFYDPPRDYGG